MRESNINTMREKMQLLIFSSQINSSGFDVTLMGTFSSTKPTFKQVLRYVKYHWETGGPNISMVSRTRERWSRNELTDTRRIRASSARHLLKQAEQQYSKGHRRVYSSRRNKNAFLTQKGCCQTVLAPFRCHLSSAPCLVTANAGRWRPHGRMERERPESCKKGQGQMFHFKTVAFVWLTHP